MKKKIDWGEYLFLLAILGYLAYYLSDIRGYAFRAVFWPYCLMGAVVVLTAVVGISIYRTAPAREAAASEAANPLAGLREAKPILLVVAAVVLYALLLKPLGFSLCTFLLTLWFCWYLNRGYLKAAIVTTVCLTASLYLVFGIILDMRLPVGKLFG